MKTILVRCYPATWRARYGDEFAAVLDERPLGPFDVADILLGALDARLRLRGSRATLERSGVALPLRIGGVAAIVGPVLLAIATVGGLGLVPVDQTVVWILMLAGLAVLVVAMAGLSAYQARIRPRLTWSAFALTVTGLVAGIVGWLGMSILGELSWTVWFVGLMVGLAGSALFAVATYRTVASSRLPAVVLCFGSILPFFNLGDSTTNEAVLLAAIACFLLGWLGLGIQALRLDRLTGVPRAA